MRVVVPADTGRVQIVSASDPREVRLAVPDEDTTEPPRFRQWFHFEARGVGGDRCAYAIVNAEECTYADAFEGYRVRASYDGERWFAVDTEWDGKVLRFFHEPEADTVRYAYFAPYPTKRRTQIVREARARGFEVETVARTRGKDAVLVLTTGSSAQGARKLWVVAHQHPGETMASWFAEGLIGRLGDGDDPLVASLLERACVHVVPCVNPEGARRGRHRTNPSGLDLNRQWWDCDEARSPEVFGVRRAMYERGVDFFLDVHGDEHIAHVFVAGAEGNPHYTDRIEALEDMFSAAMLDASPHFQTEDGYPKDAPGKGDLRCAGNYAGEAFDCLSLTLEMPFKDDATTPDEECGWSPDRCRALAASTVEALAHVVDALR
jgi:murein tripeptide amidase MpaA